MLGDFRTSIPSRFLSRRKANAGICSSFCLFHFFLVSNSLVDSRWEATGLEAECYLQFLALLSPEPIPVSR
jgi:hypothetical protein